MVLNNTGWNGGGKQWRIGIEDGAERKHETRSFCFHFIMYRISNVSASTERTSYRRTWLRFYNTIDRRRNYES